LQYAVHFDFVDNVIIFHITLGQKQRRSACFVQLSRWRHQGEVGRLRPW